MLATPVGVHPEEENGCCFFLGLLGGCCYVPMPARWLPLCPGWCLVNSCYYFLVPSGWWLRMDSVMVATGPRMPILAPSCPCWHTGNF